MQKKGDFELLVFFEKALIRTGKWGKKEGKMVINLANVQQDFKERGKMRLAFQNMQGALWEKVRRTLKKARRISEKVRRTLNIAPDGA